MNNGLGQSAVNALNNHAGVATTYTLSSGVVSVLGLVAPIVGLLATSLGVVSMCIIIRNNRKKSTLLDMQIAEHRMRLSDESD